jgi:hypothetical protein
MGRTYDSLQAFYPFYLSQHRNGICRLCHVLGSTSVLAILVLAIVLQNHWLGWLMIPAGYSFAWIGHFVFEKNRPATFGYPGYSLASDWIMYKDILTGRLPLLGDLPEEFWNVPDTNETVAV